ncbi:MAG: PBP1A family penicillin-binding protein [Proteobacteria bacterium]|nr:PBP1A family penicillin-binding protein [Pseudomonadota bacterium]
MRVKKKKEFSRLLKDGKEKNRVKESWIKAKFKRVILFAAIFAVLFPIVTAAGAYFFFTYNLPTVQALKNYSPGVVTLVYSQDDKVIGEFFIERRYTVPLSQIPPLLIQAFVAAEDAHFFEHKGIDYISIMRAAFKNIEHMEIVQGGSTITQQITKSLLLTPQKSFSRKIKEAILAHRIEKSLTKNEILNLYLNQIYLGHGAYGVEAAAKTYFGKTVKELNLAEIALIAGLPKAPATYSPFRYPDRAKSRQLYVLDRMVERGYITSEEAEKANKTVVRLMPHEGKVQIEAPYFTEHVRKYLMDKYGEEKLYRGGLKVYTTLNLSMQKAAEKACKQGIEEFEQREGQRKKGSPVQAALLCLDVHTGSVRAMVGGKDFSQNEFNRAIQSRRQPGSSFKPIVYAAALDKGFTPASLINDSPVFYSSGIRGEPWRPENYDGEYHGPTSLRKALTNSVNVVTVKILDRIGVNYVINYARNLGVQSPLSPDLTLALGSSGVSLLELVRAYAAFPSLGALMDPLFITKIVDRDGVILEQNRPRMFLVISPQTAYLMTSILQSVVEEGTGRKVSALHYPCAGKTGTTNEFRDAWFIGYTPDLIAGVWIGFDDRRPLGRGETGAQAASPIWLYFMQRVVEGTPMRFFSIPDGIVFMKVDARTGGPATSSTRDTVFELWAVPSVRS